VGTLPRNTLTQIAERLEEAYLMTNSVKWQQQAQLWLEQENYNPAIALYEEAIAAEPHVKSYYWQLGLLLLLNNQEAEAQLVWLSALAEADAEQMARWEAELTQVLDTESDRREHLEDYETAWVIRQHLREVQPHHTTNLLQLLRLSAQLENLTADDLRISGILELLPTIPSVESRQVLLTLKQVLHFLQSDPVILDFTAACLGSVENHNQLLGVILPSAIQIAYQCHHPKLGADLLELYLRVDSNNSEVLTHLANFYQNAHCFEAGIKTAQRCFDLAQSSVEQLIASHLIVRGYLTAGGHWQAATTAMERHKQLIRAVIAEHPLNLRPVEVTRLMTACNFLPYFQDNLQENHLLQNQLMALCQENSELQAKADGHDDLVSGHATKISEFQAITSIEKNQRLKVGYLSHCLGSHSVGWLARWLIQHHDRDQVELYGYFINERNNDSLFDWYKNQMDAYYTLTVKSANDRYSLAEQIRKDGIQLLVDLDSMTLDIAAQVVALKPAPVQVTWLGWDASGLPAIDYFIADPYVLPDWANEHYSEKIWRLPNTYIAIDGFEVNVPSLHRTQLDIPDDAVIYLSAQTGYKRHAETARLQLKILKEVPNSYFLIKGQSDQSSIQLFFEELAIAEGVNPNRLRFLPETAMESTHRANLAIADVVLDTYPYNGATTTLETLWMGVPLVTRVGETFSARNSYSMLMNVGITEGIAWSAEDYVEWGIRFGKDESLRQQVHWKLRQSRQTSPLWNAKEFTQEMEKAYQAMWTIYRDGQG
jgi:predicted O-linked N-acetylglucosamine transferase (SPINDLY family)